MQKRRLWGYYRFAMLAVLIAAGSAGTAIAATTSNSTNYEASEMQFNAGSQESCSSAYCATASIGDTDGGTRSSASTAAFGDSAGTEPMLEVIVDPGESDLGVLTTERTATKSMVVRIRNYLSNGYTLQITGTPPKYANHTLATPTSPTASQQGTEQFGINATANTMPSVGALPVQVPSGEFSFGTVDEEYATSNLFKYSSGDAVARSTSQSGRTDYTISMLINISNATPAGHYAGDFAAVVIPVY